MKTVVLEDEVCSMLIRCGISQNLKGFLYLKEAVMLSIHNPNITFQLTKILYPKVADKYETTAGCVERSIRHAINKSWRESLEYGLEFNFIFNRKPSNGVFIKSISSIIKEENFSWHSVWRERYQRC